jgi:hypothetical protein
MGRRVLRLHSFVKWRLDVGSKQPHEISHLAALIAPAIAHAFLSTAPLPAVAIERHEELKK